MINTVKVSGKCYLVNGTHFVQPESGDRYYAMILEWIEQGNTPTPEFTAAEILQQTIDEANNAARAELLRIDLASIRVMREYVATLADAPQIIKDREKAAAAERAKIK